jgi:hypothetical protein
MLDADNFLGLDVSSFGDAERDLSRHFDRLSDRRLDLLFDRLFDRPFDDDDVVRERSLCDLEYIFRLDLCLSALLL